jgi:glycosyltransferase involved in cell wall biosynthesis
MVSANHIAVILHDFSTGGSERIAIRLANRWAEQGRQVSLICGTKQGAARTLVGPGVDVYSCQPETMRAPWSRMVLGWRMARLVRALRPDVVFSPGNFHLIILAFLARQGFENRPAFVSKLSNPVRRTGLRKRLERIADSLIRFAARPVDMLVAMSPSLGREARAVFVGNAVAEIAEPILDDEPIEHRDCRDQGASVTILCAARLAPQKNLLLAIQAFAALPPHINARLLILGEGPLRRTLEREAKRLEVASKVDLPGHVSNISPYLACADIYLMTSHYEGYPAVLVEAIAAGLPIVTTNCSQALPEILASPSLGQIVFTWSACDVAFAIAAQLEKPQPDLASAAEIANRHRMAQSANAYLDLFDSLAVPRQRGLQSSGLAPVVDAPSPTRSVARET